MPADDTIIISADNFCAKFSSLGTKQKYIEKGKYYG